MAYVAPITWTTGMDITAARLNQDIRDNPSFLANPPTVRVKDSTDQSIANDTVVLVNWDGEDWDTDVIHDNATNNTRLTAKTAGKYRVWFSGVWADNSTGRRLAIIFLNGTTNLVGHSVPASRFSDFELSAEVQLAVNDFVEAQVLQASGGALSFLSTNSIAHFGMTWVSL